MVIGSDIMVHIGLLDYSKHQVLQWDAAIVTMKPPGDLIGQTDLTSREMCEMVI